MSRPPGRQCRGGKGRAFGAAAASPPPRSAAPAGPASETCARGGAGREAAPGGEGPNAESVRRSPGLPGRLLSSRSGGGRSTPTGRGLGLPSPPFPSEPPASAAATEAAARAGQKEPGLVCGAGRSARREARPALEGPSGPDGRAAGGQKPLLCDLRAPLLQELLWPWGSPSGGRCRCCWRWVVRPSTKQGL